MKKVLLFFGLVIFSLTIHAQQLSENFESGVFPPAGWKAVTVTGANSWKHSSIKARSGKFSAFVDYELNSNGAHGLGEHWLITPLIAQISSSDKITFYISSNSAINGYPIPDGFYDSLKVYVSTAGNNPSDFSTKIGTINLDSVKFAEGFVKYEFSFPSSVYGQNVYVGFKHIEVEGTGLFIDDVTAGTKIAHDAVSKALNITDKIIFQPGQSITIVDTVYNNGTAVLPAGIPVSYMVNGTVMHTDYTTASISPGGKTHVTFSGSKAFTPAAIGSHEIKVYTDYASDGNRTNDTIVYHLKVQEPISALPYFMNFDEPTGWSNGGNHDFEYLSYDDIHNRLIIGPNGEPTMAAGADTYSRPTLADSFLLRTPLLNLTSTTKPMLNFYVAAQNLIGFSDSLSVVVSTDGGATYGPPLYGKSERTSSKLRTTYSDETRQTVWYAPAAADHWRHEIVDLSAYAGNPAVMVIIKVIGGRANNVWIDNVKILDQPTETYSQVMVTSPGVITGPLNMKINFHSIPAPDYVRIQGHDQYPDHMYEVGDRFKAGITATSNSGETIAPTEVKTRYFTVAYSGNTETRALYDISIDLTGMPDIAEPDKYVIATRSDEEERWIPLNTTRSGNILTTTGLDRFSDFAIGYYYNPVPVTIVDFSGKVSGNAILLAWRTAQEMNIASYDVQRWNGATWMSIGNRASQRNSMENNYTLIDGAPLPGTNLYRLKINGDDGITTYSEVVKVLWSVSANKVYQNVPNPLKDYTIIRYDLAKAAKVKIVIYDIRGTQIGILENSQRNPGTHQVRWEAANLPSGTYFYSVIIDDEVTSKSMLKIK